MKRRELAPMLRHVIASDEMVQQDDGTWPWIETFHYPTGGAADQAAYRIRHATMKLPDVDGGDAGVWEAKVTRKVRGRRGKAGPAVLWVKYKGRTDEMIGADDG